jgi:hypothetical protein
MLVACGDDDGGTSLEPPPSGPPTLSADVQPIFNNNCAFNGCHGGTILEPPGKPMSLAEGQSWTNTVGVESLQRPGMARITAGAAEDSYLVHKIQGTNEGVGGSGQRMPLNLPELSSAEIDVIREWIDDGAKNN